MARVWSGRWDLVCIGTGIAMCLGMVDYDNSYKLLFSEPQMMEDLLRGFVKEGWVGQLDFSTLERVDTSHVSFDLQARADDIIWRVRFAGQWLYVYLLLEFQSTPDKFMAVRTLTYVALLYEAIVKSKQFTPKGKLPPVLPIVLYNGARRWVEAEEIFDLIENVPGGPRKYAPHLEYLLLDQGRFEGLEPDSAQNLVSALFRLENSRTNRDILLVVEELLRWLTLPEQSSISRAFAVWFNRVFKAQKAKHAQLPDFEDLGEVRTMLSETVQGWFEEATKKGMEKGMEKGREEGREEGMEKGREKGREEGREEGMEKGQIVLLTKQIEFRFGEMPSNYKERLNTMTSEKLILLSERIFQATNLEDLFED